MLKKILKTLRSIEGLLMDILLELRKKRGCGQAVQPSEESPSGNSKQDKWLEEGISNILSYQPGKKNRGEGE